MLSDMTMWKVVGCTLPLTAVLMITGCGGAAESVDSAGASSTSALSASSHPADARECGTKLKTVATGMNTVPVPVPDTVLVYFVFTATSEISGLGLSQQEFQYFVNRTNGQVDGDMTMTAANGDILLSHITGTALPAGAPYPPYIYRLEQHGTFVGGTGRFAEATGSYAIIGSANMVTREVMVTLDGHVVREQHCN